MGREGKKPKAVSRPIMVAPEKRGANCAFKTVCRRKCITPQRPVIEKKAKRLVRKRVKDLVKKINRITDSCLDEKTLEKKISLAKELVFILEGVAIPRKNGGTEYAVCGQGKGNGMQVMQMFSYEELGEILQGISLQIDLAGGYMGASEKAAPSGLYFAFSHLLAHRSAIELPERQDAIGKLIIDGGMEGIRMVSRMAGEPAISLEKRKEYLKALSWVISCAEFSGGEPTINKKDYLLAASLSRFMPIESIGELEGGVETVDFYHMESPGPGTEINIGFLKQMVELAVSELFMGLVDTSARMNAIFSSSPEQIENYYALGEEYYHALEFGTKLLAGKGAPNREILLHVCKSKKDGMSGMEQRDIAMLNHILHKLNSEGVLDQSAAESLFSSLGNNNENLQEELTRIHFYPGTRLKPE
ncbi:hypothetical protein GF415_03575 [Candidatus Micrarchaeota archaeon]|nr:hypothetical protein [Candidatus Micrarchaeota archaeon]